MRWSSYIYTCIPFLLDLTSIRHPTLLGHHRVLCWVSVLCSEFPLAVYVMYGSVHMSVPIHPILPNHIHTSLLYTCVSIPAVQIGLSVPLFWILHISIVTLKKKKKHSIPQAQIKFMSCPTSPWQASSTKNRHSSEPKGCVGAEPLFCLGPWASLQFTLLFCQRCLMCWWTAVCCTPLQSFGLLYGQGGISSSVPDFCSFLFFFLGQTN